MATKTTRSRALAIHKCSPPSAHSLSDDISLLAMADSTIRVHMFLRGSVDLIKFSDDLIIIQPGTQFSFFDAERYISLDVLKRALELIENSTNYPSNLQVFIDTDRVYFDTPKMAIEVAILTLTPTFRIPLVSFCMCTWARSDDGAYWPVGYLKRVIDFLITIGDYK